MLDIFLCLPVLSKSIKIPGNSRGDCSVGTILLGLFCGDCSVLTVLWGLFCGDCSVGTVLWEIFFWTDLW